MKRKLIKNVLWIALAMATAMALFAAPARAASTNTVVAVDGFFGKIWGDVSSNSSFHLLDNLTPATFYDFNEHTLMAGGTTAIYRYRALSADVGVVKSIDNQAAENGAIPIVGLNFHGGTLINNTPALRAAVDNAGFDQGLLKYLTAGAWTGRDFKTHITRYGVYGGFLVLFE